jgi:CRP-like cAMP-binding protein
MRKDAKLEPAAYAPAGCTKKELVRSRRSLTVSSLLAGTKLIEEGRQGHEFFLLVDGEVDVRMKGRKVKSLANGAFFGEMALVSSLPRNATITALSPVRVLVVHEQAFRRLLRDSPGIQLKVLQTPRTRRRERTRRGRARVETVPRAVGSTIALEVGSIDDAPDSTGARSSCSCVRMHGMAFVDMGDQFLASPKDARKALTRAGISGSCRRSGGGALSGPRGRCGDLRRQLVPRPVGEPGAGRRLLRDPVHEDARDPARHGPRAREERVGAARAAGQGSHLIDLSHHELFNLLVLLTAGATMLVLAPKLRVPYPIILVLGGLALGFVPGLPEINLPPDLVLVGVLPLLLYGAAFFTSLRDQRELAAGRVFAVGPCS